MLKEENTLERAPGSEKSESAATATFTRWAGLASATHLYRALLYTHGSGLQGKGQKHCPCNLGSHRGEKKPETEKTLNDRKDKTQWKFRG